MLRSLKTKLFKNTLRRKRWNQEIDPDEILIDAKNLPEFDQSQFEGRLEKPIGKRTSLACGVFFGLILLVFTGKIFMLQIKQGEVFAKKSAANTLRQKVIFPERGIIYDRNKTPLAVNKASDDDSDFSKRAYAEISGISHILGYVRYPIKDTNGIYHQNNYEGVDGIEKIYNLELSGKKGMKIVETDALGKVETESLTEPPLDGENLTLSIDSRVQQKLYEIMKKTSLDIGFSGGAGAIMDVDTGEILVATSFPEYNSSIMSDKSRQKEIKAFVENPRNPFLDRVTDGLYTPGSVIKPFIALAALKENIIAPEKQIESTGSISIPNPFNPKLRSVFKDWKAHGFVDMRHAIAVSSDVYFYAIGGGFEDQKGLGIEKIDSYLRIFGFGENIPGNPFFSKKGSIPTPAWKLENFNNDPWRIGDTYNTSIGQYGFQVTPLQIVRATAALANGGKLLNPTIMAVSGPDKKAVQLPFGEKEIAIVKEGMRLAVLKGTAKSLDIPQVEIAGKTGTAELGSSKRYVNSWINGFFPYEKPRYAFAVIMEKGPYDNTVGALYVMRQLMEWMIINTPEYIK